MMSNKRPLENGGVLKYKPRKVSSFRDFPPGCGPNAVAFDSNPEEAGRVGFGILDGIGAESTQVTKNVLGDDVLNPKMTGLRGSSEGVEFKLADKMETEQLEIDSEIEHLVGFEIGRQPHEAVDSPVNGEITGSLDILVEKIVVDVDSSENLVEEIGPFGNQLPSEAKFETHEVALSKPSMEGRAGSTDAMGGQVTAPEMDGFPNDIDELMTADELVELMRLNDTKSDLSMEGFKSKGETVTKESDNTADSALSRNPGEVLAKSTPDANASFRKELMAGVRRSLPLVSGCVKPETSLRPKEKFRTRRVSAVRDFPLQCVPNAVFATDENDRALNSGKDCSVGRPVPHMVRTQAIGDEPGSGTVSKKVSGDSVNDAKEPIERESFSQSPRRNNHKRSQHMSASLGNELHREVIHGLMAAPNCPHRKEKVSKSNSDDTTRGSESRQKNLSHQTKSKSVGRRTTVVADFSGGTSMEKMALSDSQEVDVTPSSSVFMGEERTDDQRPLEIAPPVFQPVLDDSSDEEPDENAIIVAPPRKVFNGGGTSRTKEGKKKFSWLRKGKFVARKSKPPSVSEYNNTSYDAREPTIRDDEGYTDDAACPESSSSNNMQDVVVSLPPFGSTSSGRNDARHKVRETLRLFNTIYRKLLQREESKSTSSMLKKGPKRFDLMTAKIIKEKGKEVNTERQILGEVPGVEVGDEFQYRVELSLVGIHRMYQGGIDWMKYKGVQVAACIVASGAYEDDLEHAEELHYCGAGGNAVGKTKAPEDQKLERGNLALKNSIDKRTPVRVVRGWKETRSADPQDTRPKMVMTYVYDGLYTVVNCSTEVRDNRNVFMFKLVRNPGQPELKWKELMKSNRSKTRPGTCLNDVSRGQESLAIAAVNTLDSDEPPPFHYIPKMMHPSWLKLNPPPGCSCTGRCSDTRKCMCAAKNGGEIPYNHNGAIVESKPMVYECGPHCRCPPSCYNRVSQRGVRLQLEVFKTEKRGWGVRALTSVPSGSFICEYSGELLQDKEAEERIGNDEYLFDIGHNYQENSLNPDERASLAEGGYTIDAAKYGNVGRFINHSCSPNLYAQYVIYDHDDKKMPHVMLFAMENIPPLQELTYHYNYSVDQIRDADGNIKVKKCYCGSADCNGRLY